VDEHEELVYLDADTVIAVYARLFGCTEQAGLTVEELADRIRVHLQPNP
jgi:hypothetical protein